MGEDNLVEFGAALQGREALERLLAPMADAMRGASPPQVADSMRSLLAPVDQRALDAGFAAHWSATMAATFAQGVTGWLDDDAAFLAPWGFDLGEIAVPALVWHGREDRFVPVSHGEWLAAHVPGAEVRIGARDGHLSLLVDRVPAVHDWLLEQSA